MEMNLFLHACNAYLRISSFYTHMKSLRLILFILTLAGGTAFAQPSTLTTKKLTKEVSMLFPESFVPMTDDDLASRFATDEKPLSAFISPSGLSEFTLNKAVTRWASEDIGMMKDFYKASIPTFYDGVKFKTDTLVEVNGRKMIFFELESFIKGVDRFSPLRKYIFLAYAIKDYRIYVFSFSTPLSEEEKWRPQVWKMMQSINLK